MPRLTGEYSNSVPAVDLESESHIDPKEAALAQWVSESDSDEQYELRDYSYRTLLSAMNLGHDDPLQEMDTDFYDGLELPSAEMLRETGLTTPRLKAIVDFSESQGLEALTRSLDALEVVEIKAARLSNGQVPTQLRLDKVQALDLTSAEGGLRLDAVVAAVASWPALRTISIPQQLTRGQAPSGWHFNQQRQLQRNDWGQEAPELANQRPSDDVRIAFVQQLRVLLRLNTAVAAPILAAYRERLNDVDAALEQRPELNASVAKLLTQQSGSCIDAGLRRLDDLQMLLRCGHLKTVEDAGHAALRIALLNRADQLMAVEHLGNGENIERANALRVLIDQRLNAAFGLDLPVSSAPAYSRIAGLTDVKPGEIPTADQWPKGLRLEADRVFREEITDDFSGAKWLLAEEEGVGALISNALACDPAYQADAASLEKTYQVDYAKAQEADPDNPMAGIDLHAAKEQALMQRRFELLKPWTTQLSAWVREHIPPAPAASTGPT